MNSCWIVGGGIQWDRPHFSVIHEKLEDLANSKVVSSSAHSVVLYCHVVLRASYYHAKSITYSTSNTTYTYVCLYGSIYLITCVLYTPLQNLLDFQNYDMYIYSQFEEPVALSTVL